MYAAENRRIDSPGFPWPYQWLFLLGLPVGLAFLSPILGGSLSVPESPDEARRWITSESLADNLDNYLIIDTREPEAYTRSHIPGALHLDPRNYEEGLQRLLRKWTPGRPILVYCSTRACGQSTAIAASLEQDLGLDTIWVLEGGWEAWLSRPESSP